MEPWVIWLSAGILLLILEALTPTIFFLACLGMAALVTAVSTFFLHGAGPWVVFFLSSIFFVLASRPLAERLTKKPRTPSNIESLLGKKARVIEAVDEKAGTGRVVVGGEEWRAISDTRHEAGATVEVREQRGNKLYVV